MHATSVVNYIIIEAILHVVVVEVVSLHQGYPPTSDP